VSVLLPKRVYQRDSNLSDPAQIRQWWEERRLFYNVVVGGVGIMTTGLMVYCGLLSEPLVGAAIGIPDPPIFMLLGIIAYGIAANVCYTAGWIVEKHIVGRGSPSKDGFGLRAFSRGVTFSVGLTLFPAILTWAVFLFDLTTGQRQSGAQ